MTRIVKLRSGRVLVPVTIEETPKTLKLSFRFNASLKDEVKAMEGARFDWDRKVWSIARSRRNETVLRYLQDEPVFDRYDKPLDIFPTRRPQGNENGKVKPYQVTMLRHLLTRKRCIVAGEMRVGKTLPTIEALEALYEPGQNEEVWWVALKKALLGVRLEFRKWRCEIPVRFLSYDELKRSLQDWTPGRRAPRIVVLDESDLVRNPGIQRSEAAYHLAMAQMDDWGERAYLFCLTGTPAPHNPTNWWHQVEICCPGFLRESNVESLKRRLAVIETGTNNVTGQPYPILKGWKKKGNPICEKHGIDRSVCPCEEKGLICPTHKILFDSCSCVDEVALLGKRLEGLVLVVLRKGNLELPEKVYHAVKLKPSSDTIRAAFLLANTAGSAIEALARLRQLSDGFRYTDEGVKRGHTPKDEALGELLDEYEESGRFIVYAGFHESIDRVVEVCQLREWDVIQSDGRGLVLPRGWKTGEQALWEFSQGEREEKLVYVGHPQSGGRGIDLSASSGTCFYSNDWAAGDRWQAEDRMMGPEMNVRGGNVYDLLHLPTDELIMENLLNKKDLQTVSMPQVLETLAKFAGA